VISPLRFRTAVTLSSAAAASAVLLLGCGNSNSKAADHDPSTTGVPVDLDSCPALAAQRTAVVFDEQALRAAAPETVTAAVWLREPAWPRLPSCGGANQEDRGARCAERDQALELRVATGSKEFECTLIDGLGLREPYDIERALAGSLKPIYWEDPYHFSSSEPAPVLRAFRTPLTWPLVEQLARHPYVEQIDTVPGHAPIYGTLAPAPPADCPTEREDPASKLTELEPLRGAGRGGVGIGLSLKGMIEQVPCEPGGGLPEDCELCDPFIYGEWERAIQSTRRLACLGRELDAVAGKGAIPLDYLGVTGNFCTPSFMFGVGTATTIAIGRALTWDEAERLAAHPYVESMVPFGSGTDPGEPGCPLDTTIPPPVPECSDVREPNAGKWSEESEERWKAMDGADEVGVIVRGAAKVCPIDSCPPRPNECPSFERQMNYMQEWNWQSQSCVRALIEAVGGSASEERTWLVNTINATLTWSQIQAVGAHPHVEGIGPNETGEPPP
jgi:hypothetical protein